MGKIKRTVVLARRLAGPALNIFCEGTCPPEGSVRDFAAGAKCLIIKLSAPIQTREVQEIFSNACRMSFAVQWRCDLYNQASGDFIDEPANESDRRTGRSSGKAAQDL